MLLTSKSNKVTNIIFVIFMFHDAFCYKFLKETSKTAL